MLTELRNQDLRDCFIANLDGLAGFRQAIDAMFPATAVQQCVMRKARASLGRNARRLSPPTCARFTPLPPWRRPRRRSRGLPRPGIPSARRHPQLARRLGVPHDLLRLLSGYSACAYTTNAIKSLNYSPRKIIKNRGDFLDDEAVLKLLYIAIQNAARCWIMPIRDWSAT